MAQKQSPALFTVALLLLFAAATPLAHALLPSVLNALTVTGSLCCAKNGHCPDGPPISGVPVRLVCSGIGGANVTVGQCVTGVNGDFLISVTDLKHTVLGAVTGLLGGSLPCHVEVKLPLNQLLCKELSGIAGILYGVPKLINTVLSAINGLIGCFAVTLGTTIRISA